MADVMTVIHEIMLHLDCEDELLRVAKNKHKEKGGFSKRIVLTK